MKIILGVLLALVTARPVHAQNLLLPQVRPPVDTTTKPAPTPPVVVTIDPIEIPLRAARVLARLGEVDVLLRERGAVLAAQRSAAGVNDSLRALSAVQASVPPRQLTRRAISSLAAEWNRWGVRVEDWSQVVRRRVEELDTLRAEFDREEVLWQRTVARARLEATPQVTSEAEGVLRRLGEQREAVKARQQELISSEVALSRAAETIDAGRASVGDAYANMRQQLFVIESPSLWAAISAGGWPSLSTTLEMRWRQAVDSFARFVRNHKARVIFHLIASLALLLAITRLQRHVRRADATSLASAASEAVEETTDHRWVVEHPNSSTMLMAALTTVVLYPTAPMIAYDIALLVATMSVWRLLPSLVPERVVSLTRWGFGLLVFDRVAIVLLYSTPWHRLAILGVAAAALVLGLRIRRQFRSLDYERRREQRTRWAQRGITVGVLLAAISIPSNLVGNVTLALVASAVVVLTCLAILATVGSTVVNGLLAIGIAALTDDLKILARKGPQILQSASRLVRFAFAASWVAAALAVLLLWDPFKDFVSASLALGVSIGKTDVTIATVLLFFGIIWFGAVLGRWIALLLEADVLGRLSLPHGMSVTIATIVQYALTAIAFFLALAATGVELGQLTIIGGALSVGVGFGLQTIVNNFISGLILAFERPVSIGDTIQLDNLEGVVTKIGIRASVIRIPSGADLIIPNGRLLDRDLINWTRSGRNRRIEIPLRVQSGIEPRAIVDLLPTIAARHRDVSQVPPPTCVFKGFGDSSTDFVLACWTFAADHGAVRSEISLQAEEELRKAGYSSPFPQQDLHLRSVSKDVVAAFGNLESATNTPTHIESER